MAHFPQGDCNSLKMTTTTQLSLCFSNRSVNSIKWDNENNNLKKKKIHNFIKQFAW